MVVVTIYNPGGRLEAQSAEFPPADVNITVEVVSINPATYSTLLRLHVTEVAPGLESTPGRLAAPLRLAVTGSDGTDDELFAAGSALGTAEAVVGMSGEEAGYPFDTYASGITVSAGSLGSAPEGAAPPVEFRSVALTVVGGEAGWHSYAKAAPLPGGDAQVDFEFERAFSTKFFALLLLAMALVIGLFSFVVGVALVSGRQPVDSSIVGWGAALLFALLALRNYMPAGPPIGAGIDVYAYMWATLLAFTGAAMAVVMWLRRRWAEDDSVGSGPQGGAELEDVSSAITDADAGGADAAGAASASD